MQRCVVYTVYVEIIYEVREGDNIGYVALRA